MRIFPTLAQAVEEVRRDVYKGAAVKSHSVQQRALDTEPRERMFYTYMVREGFPGTPKQLGRFAVANDFITPAEEDGFVEWLNNERWARIYNSGTSELGLANEKNHPALLTTLEGNHPSYTYTERMFGCAEVLSEILRRDPTSRRAYWPIYHPLDSLRAAAPTRVPCTLGYHAMIREIAGEPHLHMTIISRSVDFDTFWLTDLWLTYALGELISQRTRTKMGPVIHHIQSFHSFKVAGHEIY